MKFKECSWSIKVGVVGGWVALILLALSFGVGYIQGLMV